MHPILKVTELNEWCECYLTAHIITFINTLRHEMPPVSLAQQRVYQSRVDTRCHERVMSRTSHVMYEACYQ